MIEEALDKYGIQEDAPEGTESEPENLEILDPFNPSDVDIITKTEVVAQLLGRIERAYTGDKSAHINLAPEFQRKGGIWTVQKQSQLIESILLGIPLPMFYVSATRNGEWDVVDGIQRLGILRDFVLGESYLKTVVSGKPNLSQRGNGFKLTGLEFLQQFEGLPFNRLPSKQQDDIRDCNVQVTIIRAGTPEQVKFNIFKRLNTGGVPLTSQEVRHALYQGAATRFLKQLVELPIFILATSGSIKDARMEGRELILRVLAGILLGHRFSASKIDIENVLNSTMRVLNTIGGTPDQSKTPLPEYTKYTLEELEIFFSIGMQRALEMFGPHAFRKSQPGQRRTQINKALFETWSVSLGKLDDFKWSVVLNHSEIFSNNWKKLLSEDGFLDSVSSGSYLSKNIEFRYKAINGIIEKTAMGEEYDIKDGDQ